MFGGPPAIAVPTLVLHRAGDDLPIDGARWAAGQIPGATFIELAGGMHFPFLGNWEAVVDAIESFLRGVWERGEWEEPETTAHSRPSSSPTSWGRPRGPAAR